MFNYNSFAGGADATEVQYTESYCHDLSQALVKHCGQGEIYLLVCGDKDPKGRLRRNILHSYYYHEGVYSDIIGNFTGLEAEQKLIDLWSDRYSMNPETLSIIPLSQATHLNLIDFIYESDFVVEQEIIDTILQNRELLQQFAIIYNI